MLQKSFVNRKKIFLPILLLLAVLAVLFLCVSMLTNNKTYYKGISVENRDLSGLSKKQAAGAVQKRLEDAYGSNRLVFSYKEQKWEYTLKDIAFKFLANETLNRAFEVGRQGNPFSRISRIVNLSFDGMDFSVPVDYDRKKIYDILTEIKKSVDLEKRDAQVLFPDGNIQIEKEIPGKSLDVDKNIKLVENHIENRKFDNILLQVDEDPPRITCDGIRGMSSVIAAFSTGFNSNDTNRSHNIRIACSKINGAILMQNDVFSMNGVLGPRTVENGYKDAMVIYKDEYVPGLGGGVCQVTTTLYDTVLKAKLGIVERNHHTMPSAYVPAGQDATIAEDYIDLKFKNTRDYPVSINAFITGNRINIRIYGKDPGDGNIVKLRSQVISRRAPAPPEYIVDNSIPNNETKVEREARMGLRVVVYRETYDKAGNLLSTEKISEDSYKSIRAQIKVNQTMYNTLFY